MADPLGFISGSGGINPALRPPVTGSGAQQQPEASFKDVVMQKLDEVNRLQQEYTKAVEDLQTGQRNDLESVILASNKADNAFRMLQALRNRVMEAYEEVKQMRV